MGAEGLKKQPLHSDVPITQRQTITREVATEHLDRLLVAVCDIPPDATVASAATAIVAVAAEVLDDAAVGVCTPGSDSGQIIVRKSPRVSHAAVPDPSRLFPEF